MLNFLIKDALIYNGLGGKPFKGAVGIKNDLIESIFRGGEQLPKAELIINA
ncbi:hypothetical protein MNBD_BACTEROID06-1763, partial [hydrothermal vent metagenome]